MKKICYLLTFLCVLFSFECFGNDTGTIKGEIIRTTQNKLSITLGEMAITNLGKKDGVIKGDIFKITEEKNPDLKGPIGKCAVLDVKDTESTCEIVQMSKEIRKGNLAILKKITFSDSGLYQIIYDSLNVLLKPYEPYKIVSVYIYKFFDENNNVTKFSELLKREFINIMSQKRRIKLVSDELVLKGLSFYPKEDIDTKFIEDYMKRDDINILITGSYRINNDTVDLTIYLIDEDFNDYQLKFALKANDYNKLLSEVIIPYSPIDRKDVICDLFYKPFRYMPQKDEKKYFIDQESGKDPFIQYNLGKIDFNIISPVNFKIKIENNIIGFDEKKEYKITLSNGSHRMAASFKRGFYYNDTLMYTSSDEIKKEILFIVDKEGEINIDIDVNPMYEKENISFKIYKKEEKEKFILKPIYQTEKINQIETYKY